ncbi:MAG: hypothetical protein K0R18_1797 [Bacillales bacterium]|jgi:tetratricopeptide (TPR) repeat protein|nr:hypothetical protein [Bacillales bacterium]
MSKETNKKKKEIEKKIQPQKSSIKIKDQSEKGNIDIESKLPPKKVLFNEEKRKEILNSLFQESEVIDENADIDELIGEDVSKLELWVIKKHFSKTSSKIRHSLIRYFEKLGQTFPVLKRIHAKVRLGVRDIKSEITGKKEGNNFSLKTFIFLLISTLLAGMMVIYILNQTILKTGVSAKIVAQVEFYEDKVDKKPNDPNMRVQLGKSYLLNKEADKAINQFNRALDIEKNYYSAVLNLAIAYQTLNDDTSAIKYGKQAILISKYEIDSYLVIAHSYKKTKNYKMALESLLKANSLSPNSADILVELGEIAEEMGNKTAAKGYYDKALSFDPSNKKVQKAVTRLSKDNTK